MAILETYIVDAFSDVPFKGNPAGVCLTADFPLSETDMQNIAAELNLSETVFITKDNTKENLFYLRYFTPTTEVDFCGHATFAAAKLVMEKTGLAKVYFETFKKLAVAAWLSEGKVHMYFPLFELVDYPAQSELLEAMGITSYIKIKYESSLSILLIHIESPEEVASLSPDFTRLLEVETPVKEVVITAVSKGPYDFVSRCFCPWIGINEDPVTGAAHCLLATYYQEVLGKNSFFAYQCSKRGGYLNLFITKDNKLEVSSNAKIILRGTIDLQ